MTMVASPIRPGARTQDVLGVLERAGWGDLDGDDLKGARAVLRALGGYKGLLNPKTGSGRATVAQIATRSCYKDRWIRHNLTMLEDLGVLEWRRGGVVAGRPSPSWFRINRSVLVALIPLARAKRDEALEALRQRTVARLRGLRVLNVRARSRRSRHAAVGTALPPNGDGTGHSPVTVPSVVGAVSASSGASSASSWCTDHDMANPRLRSGLPGCPICRKAAAK